MLNLKNRAAAMRLAVLSSLLGLGQSAFATGAYDTITTAVSWTDVSTAIIGVFAAGAVVLVTMKGGSMILSAIRRG